MSAALARKEKEQGIAPAASHPLRPAPPGQSSTHSRPKLYLASHRRPDGSVVTFDANGNRAGRITKITCGAQKFHPGLAPARSRAEVST